MKKKEEDKIKKDINVEKNMPENAEESNKSSQTEQERVMNIIKKAKEKGNITYGELAIALESTPEKIKDFVKEQVFCQIQG